MTGGRDREHHEPEESKMAKGKHEAWDNADIARGLFRTL
jgi:hypothetical protein